MIATEKGTSTGFSTAKLAKTQSGAPHSARLADSARLDNLDCRQNCLAHHPDVLSRPLVGMPRGSYAGTCGLQ